MSIHFMFFQCF